jgi:hypothetical protein
MAAEVKLGLIIEALEMADDSVSSYLDIETGESWTTQRRFRKPVMAV